MHELKITETIIKKVLEECKRENIESPSEITLELGKLTSFKKDSIEFYYDMFSKDVHELKNTKLIVKEVQGKLHCKSCKGASFVDEPFFMLCSHCNSGDFDIVDGKDIKIKEIKG